MASSTKTAARREAACQALLAQARAIVDADGTGEAALESIKALLGAVWRWAVERGAWRGGQDPGLPRQAAFDLDVFWLGRGRR